LSKKFHFMRYLFFIEGAAFVTLTLAIYQHGEITAMLVASIVCTCLFSLPYGIYRTRNYFGLGWRELADWHRPALMLALWLLPAGILSWWLTRDLPAILRLGLGGVIFGLWTAWALIRHGLNPPLQVELARRLPPRIKSMLTRPVLKSET
jgi:hypothetical protein